MTNIKMKGGPWHPGGEAVKKNPYADIPISPPQPRGKVCEKMCERCPFRPDGSGYAQDHEDLPKIVQAVELGLPFYCHETALLDPRTKLDEEGEPVGIQPHFEICRGANEHHLKVWAEKARAFFKAREKKDR